MASREQAPQALKHAGIACIVAKSFARIFFRNAINIGLPLMEADIECEEGDQIEVDLLKGEVKVSGKGVFRGNKLPDFLLDMLTDGGLVAHRKKVRDHEKEESA